MDRGKGRGVPAATYEALVRCLYDNPSTLAAGAVFGTLAIACTAWWTGSAAMAAGAWTMATVGASRLLLGLAFRIADRRGPLRGHGLKPWRVAYAVGANLFSLTFGLSAMAAMLTLDDPVWHMVAVSAVIGYAAGISGRNSACLDVSLTQLWTALAPVVAGFVLHGGVGYHVMTMTGLAFTLGVTGISVGIHRSLLGAYDLADERKALAARLDSALSTMRHGFCAFGPDGRIEICSEALATILRIPPPPVGSTMDDILDACVSRGTRTPEGVMRRSALRGLVSATGHTTVEVPLRDGRVVEVTASPRPGGGSVLILDDVTERLGAEAARAQSSRLDAVTGLLNRAAMDAALDAMLAEGRAVAVHFIDLDRFKPVNDTHGHGVGDALLAAVGERLRGLLPTDALAARLGGDEFVLLQEGDAEAVAGLAMSTLRALEAPFHVGGLELSISASVGTAQAPADGTVPVALMRNADTALYRAKEAGRRAWRAYEPGMDDSRRERDSLEADLRAAIAGDDLRVAYQPQVDARTGAVVACEALVRWTHPVRGPVAPDDFLPLAEETGLIHGLGRAVLEQACAEAAKWPDHVRLSVNVSGAQFRRDLAAMVAEILAKTGLPGRRLEIEVAESALAVDPADLQPTLLRLSAMGVRIALDDFGTGASSLGYLRAFPFGKVKLDRSFAAGLHHGPGSLAVVRAIASLGRDLGMDVVAEGVETKAQLEAVTRAGCGSVQGYLISAPLQPEDVRSFTSAIHALPASPDGNADGGRLQA